MSESVSRPKQDYVRIAGIRYSVVNTLEYITLADSFVKNKIGTGHGEAKLYVGNESSELFAFFEDFSLECFFVKKDFEAYLLDTEMEFRAPQQEYQKKNELPRKYAELLDKLKEFKGEILSFRTFRADITPPRVYINSNSSYYTFMRDIGLPNISYVSIMKVADDEGNKKLYFRMFTDYRTDTQGYVMAAEKTEEERIATDATIKESTKSVLVQARVGQGDYRKQLLEDCYFCPVTLVSDERLLVASHIKPWSQSTDKEKIDSKNGLMLTPTIDRLFDRGFITFDNQRQMLVSPWISPLNQKRLGIYTGKPVPQLQLDEKRSVYMEYHREHVFKG